MKKYIIPILLILSIDLAAESKIDFSFDGYVYDLPTYMQTPKALEFYGIELEEEDFFMNQSRLRLNPSVKHGRDAKLVLNYEINTIWTGLKLPFGFSPSMTNRQAVDLVWEIENNDNFQAYHFIDRLYYRHYFDWGDVVLGRQMISWGVGRIWQPTDLFNPINPANFSKFEKDGADALSVTYYLGNFTDVNVVYNFRENWEDGNYGARFRTNYSEYDISAIAGYFDKNITLGASFAGNLFDAGVRGEGVFAANKDDIDSNYVKFILGIDYQFTSKLYGLLEYKYNGRGTTCRSCYDLQGLFEGRLINVGKYYLAGQASYQIHPLVTASITSTANLTDKSGYISANIGYSAIENLQLSLAAMVFFGKENSEFANYPPALYFVAEYYF